MAKVERTSPLDGSLIPRSNAQEIGRLVIDDKTSFNAPVLRTVDVRIMRMSLPMGSKLWAKARYVWAAINPWTVINRLMFFLSNNKRPSSSDVRKRRIRAIKEKVQVLKNDPQINERVVEGVIYGSGVDRSQEYMNLARSQVGDFTVGINEELFEIPLVTFAGGGKHAVSIVIDKANKKIYVLDTKGNNPSDLFFFNPQSGKQTNKTVAQFIGDLLNTCDTSSLTSTSQWEIQTTEATQKPGDAVFTIEAMVQGLAKQKPQERNLDTVQKNMHNNYSTEVDHIRETFFSKKGSSS